MKVAAVAVLALLAPSLATAAEPGPDLSGAWQVRGIIIANGVPLAAVGPLCQLRQQATALSGTCKGPNSEGAASGTFKGGHVSWRWDAKATNSNGMSGSALFEGDVGADGAIHGRWTFSGLPDLSGDFDQQRP